MPTPIVLSMNAMVDSITDAVETALVRGHQTGGLRRFMVQSAICRALREITDCCTPLRRFPGLRTAGGRMPTPRTLTRATAATVEALPPPPPRPWNVADTMPSRNSAASPIANFAKEEGWPSLFTYDMRIALPSPPPPSRPRPRFTDAAAARRRDFPPATMFGIGFVPSFKEERDAAPRF